MQVYYEQASGHLLVRINTEKLANFWEKNIFKSIALLFPTIVLKMLLLSRLCDRLLSTNVQLQFASVIASACMYIIILSFARTASLSTQLIMSDIWDDEEVREAPSEVTRVQRDHSQAGYLAGVTKAKDESLQEGFNSGYPIGGELGLSIGRVLGFLQGKGLSELESQARKELSSVHVFDRKYWTSDAEPSFKGTHPLVEGWEKKVENLKAGKPAE